MKNRLAFNLVIQLTALVIVVSFGFYILNSFQTREIEQNTYDKARLYSSILGANVNKILDDNLKAYRSLKSAAAHLDDIEQQVDRIRVISLDRKILASSKNEQAGSPVEPHVKESVQRVLEEKTESSIIQKRGRKEYVVHFFPILDDKDNHHLIGILQVDVAIAKGQGSLASSLRAGNKGYFRKEASAYAQKLSNELRIFMHEAQRNARYLRTLIDNMVEDKDIASIQIYSKEMNMLVAAGSRQALSFMERVSSDLHNQAIKSGQTIISKDRSNSNRLDVASPIMISDGNTQQAGGAVSLKFSLESMRRLINQRRNNHIIMNCAIVFLIILIVGFFFEVKILKPVNELVRLTDAIKKGELTKRSSNQSVNEIGELARAFNSMIDEVERSGKEIENWNVLLQKRVDTVTGELKEKSALLLKTEKMASLGILSGGIAHEINNPIGVILGNTQMLLDTARSKKGIKDQKEAEVLLSGIEEQARRCSQIVRSLLQFTRERDMEFHEVDLLAAIKNALKFLQQKIDRHHVNIAVNAADFVPEVLGDPIGLEQVIINILNNAIQSMGEREAKIDISLLPAKDISGKDNLVVTIEDNGGGITKKDLPRIFDPFFSTKEPGEGSGLGLSVSYGIIKAHGGEITVNSTKNQGTTVRIYLPVKKG